MTRIGFLSPPTMFDTTPTQFLDLAPPGTDVAGGFIDTSALGQGMAGIGLDGIRASLPGVGSAAKRFAEAGADLVGQLGMPFAFTHGSRAREAQAEVTQTAGIPVVMMGVALLDALHSLGVEHIAVAASYYTLPAWPVMARGALEPDGFDVVYQEDWIQQGIAATQAEVDQLAWEATPISVTQAVLTAAERCPHADAVVLFGGSLRLSGRAAKIEAQIKMPVVSGDLAMYWAILKLMHAAPRSSGWGQLLDSLALNRD